MSEPMPELEKQLRQAAESLRKDEPQHYRAKLYDTWANMARDLVTGPAEVAQAPEEKPAGKRVCPKCGCHDYHWHNEVKPTGAWVCRLCSTRKVKKHLVDLEEVLAMIEGSIAQYRHYSGQLMHPGAAIGPLRGIADKLRARFGGGQYE